MLRMFFKRNEVDAMLICEISKILIYEQALFSYVSIHFHFTHEWIGFAGMAFCRSNSDATGLRCHEKVVIQVC